MLKHGDKLDDKLYFCMYRITPSNHKDFLEFARALKVLRFSPNIPLTAKALGCSVEAVSQKLNRLHLGHSNKYSFGGQDALKDIFEKYSDLLEDSNPMIDLYDCYLAGFSCERLPEDFSFERDAKKLEMVVGVLTASFLDYTIHLGIQRSRIYALAENPEHANISMMLHGSAAKYMLLKGSTKKFMVTNPLESMQKIFEAKLETSERHWVKHYDLRPLRESLGLPEQNPVLNIFSIKDALAADQHFAVALEKLSRFSHEPIADVVESSEGSLWLDYVAAVSGQLETFKGKLGLALLVVSVICFFYLFQENSPENILEADNVSPFRLHR